MTTLSPSRHTIQRDSYDVIVMAASAGGIAAVSDVLSRLPATFAVPIIVVLHHARGRSEMLVRVLSRKTPLVVVEAVDGQPLRTGHVYIAPADRHMWLTGDQVIASGDGRRINFLHSSADPLLASVVSLFGRRAIAIVLSGTGKDGALGARALHDVGGMVLAQDRASSQHFGMADAAIKAGAVDEILPVGAIAQRLLDLTGSV